MVVFIFLFDLNTIDCLFFRWPEVYVSIFRKKGYKVEHGKDGAPWTGEDDDIYVNGIPLWTFVDNMDISKHDLLKDHTVLITRIFENRIKNFIKHIMMRQGKDKVNFGNYSYRIEFQLRGLPHVHGVLWIDEEWLINQGFSPNIDDCEEAALRIAKELVTVEIPEEEPLRSIVLQVQKHKHTATCRKRTAHACRFGFPKLPSEETIIAQPLSEGTEEEKKETYKKYADILSKARDYLEGESVNEDLSYYEFLKEIAVDPEDYLAALQTTKSGRIMILKRSVKERFINNYNKEWLLAWNANMDIQISFDAYSVISYIIAYISKDEPEVAKKLMETYRQVKDLPSIDQFKALKMTYLTH